MAVSDRIRHLSIRYKGEIVPKFESSSRLRSLHIFGVYGPSAVSSSTSFAGLQLLRVVNIRDVPMENFPQALTSLLHLRYLNIFNAKIKRVPSSIGKLINLEALILENNCISELPVEIHRLQRLRDLSVRNTLMQISRDAFGAKVPSGVGSLTSLRRLPCVEADSVVVRELGKLTQLRVLGISKFRREDGHDLCTSLEKMRHLQLLEVRSIGEDEEIDLHSLSHPPTTLQELYLNGHFKMLPHWIAALQNLLILCLSFSRLADDPLKALGSLPNLMVLKLFIAYDGEELCVKEGEYPKLTELQLDDLRAVKKVTVEKGAMPNLEILSIQRCQALVEVPFWLGHFTNLKRLLLEDMPTAFLKSLQSDEGAEQADFIRHISFVTHWDSQAGSNWQF